MGRKKPAPQPLSLPDPSTASTNATHNTHTSNSANSNSHSFHHRDHDGSALSADLETTSPVSATLSPADSRSPVSATARTSPFSSRFAQKRPQTARGGQSSKPTEFEPFDQRRPSDTLSDNQSPKPTSYPHIATVYDPSSAASSRQPPPQAKKSKGGFFHFNKSSKSTNQFTSHSHHRSGSSRTETQSRGSDRADTTKYGDQPNPDAPIDPPKPVKLKTSRSELSLSSAGDRDATNAQSSSKRSKANPFGILTRTKSYRDKEITSPTEIHDPMPALVTQQNAEGDSAPLRTAPVAQERSFRDMMDSSVRNRSEDRVPTRDAVSRRDNSREKESKGHTHSSNGSSAFFSGLKSSSTKAAGMFGRTLFGKSSRSGSTIDKEPAVDDEHYEIKVLNLPLAAQTRKTRISKRLEDSRDKTEFWMPAFPWRAIDYLNYKGCEVEGLYRVPGSGPQIKKWQRRFDEEFDVNLFEQDDLYDINIIGSMLKAWLRELPDELFPKAAQERISRECAGSETVPQMLIDELSNLSPFQYYLLFAITCHLSLLLAHSDKNKMDFRNLCICFQPCMKIDAFCFKFLVCDWRDCWKGCKNEPAYIEQEYILMDRPPPRAITESDDPSGSEKQGRQQSPSSNHSSKASEPGGRSVGDETQKPQQKNLKESKSKNSLGSNDSTISTTLSTNSDREPSKGTGDLRRLSPIKPLSPLGFH